ncbi:MAG: AAA family ATPase [Granulosicoccus sp.]
MSASVLDLVDDAAPTQSIVAYGLGEFMALDLPARECLLAPWLTRQGLAMVYAPRGIGKTYFALGVAYAVATAGKFLGWQSEKPCKVVYLDGEMPAATMQERLSAMVTNDDRDDIGAAMEGLQIVSQEKQDPAMPDLSSIEGQRLFDQVTDKADLIIVDNISTLCRAGAENKADDWNVVSEWALRMRRYGKTVLFVHHAGKGGQQRGTSKREDILDVVIALKRPMDDAHTGASFEVHFEKARHLFGDDTKPFVATLNDGLWKTEQLEENTYRRVVAMTNEGLTVTEIARELDRHKSNISRHVKKAKECGDVVGETNGARSEDYASRRAGK